MERYVAGVDLGGTNIKVAAFRYEDLTSVYEKRVPTEASYGWEHVMGRICGELTELFCSVPREKTVCVGMGIPGLLDVEKGISIFSPNFPMWENVPVAEWLEERLGLPVFIDNDVRVNLYGEWRLGAGRGKKDVVLLTLGTGLGSGIVMDNRVLYGATGSAGEIGHMNMYRSGRPCKCGSSGCLGRYVSAVGLVQTVREKIDRGQKSVMEGWVDGEISLVTAKMVSEAFDLGDRVAVEAMTETGEILGYGLANVINLFNPEVVIIGGGMAGAGERLLKPAREIAEAHSLKLSRERCRIVTAQLGDGAGMAGAAIYGKTAEMKGRGGGSRWHT